jgi:hypothetical protein
MALAFTFGGFTFYAAVVVPIGGQVLGTTTQGFVTRQVTNVINATSAITIMLLFCEALMGRTDRTRAANATLISCLFVMTACCLVLVALHLRLETFLDVEQQAVNDHEIFYGVHRVYLWTSTVSWLATLPIIWILVNHQQNKAAVTAPR